MLRACVAVVRTCRAIPAYRTKAAARCGAAVACGRLHLAAVAAFHAVRPRGWRTEAPELEEYDATVEDELPLPSKDAAELAGWDEWAKLMFDSLAVDQNQAAIEALTAMEEAGHPVEPLHFRLALQACSTSEHAMLLLRKMRDHNVHAHLGVYNTLLAKLSRAQDVQGARQVLALMKAQACTPSDATFGHFLYLSAVSGDVAAAWELLDKVDESTQRVHLHPRSYSHFMRGLVRASRLHDAMVLARRAMERHVPLHRAACEDLLDALVKQQRGTELLEAYDIAVNQCPAPLAADTQAAVLHALLGTPQWQSVLSLLRGLHKRGLTSDIPADACVKALDMCLAQGMPDVAARLLQDAQEWRVAIPEQYQRRVSAAAATADGSTSAAAAATSSDAAAGAATVDVGAEPTKARRQARVRNGRQRAPDSKAA